MSGRARNKPHRKKGHTRSDRDGEGVGDSEASHAPSGSDAEELPKPGPVPRICMDYFYVSSGGGSKRGAHGMTTKELLKRLRELGRSAEGQRNVLIKRYEKHMARENQEEIGEEGAVPEGGPHVAPEASEAGPHASDNPMMVMVDESTGNKYMSRAP